MEPKEISDWQHEEFYRYVAQSYDKPRYTLHYRADAPLNIRSIFYVPEAVRFQDPTLVFSQTAISRVASILFVKRLVRNSQSFKNWAVVSTEAKYVRREQGDGLQCGSVQPEGSDPDQSHRHSPQVAALPQRFGCVSRGVFCCTLKGFVVFPEPSCVCRCGGQ